jgi:two-component system, chemotaxis family, protein-glutamate methylesterase/glutaminase
MTARAETPAPVEAIVVGTSAGGVEALSTLLPMVPASLAVPIFVVVHLPRERPSLLVEIFSGRTSVPVREALDKEPVVPGTLYFAPPDYHLLLDRGARGAPPEISLSVDDLVLFSRPSIDVLFESAVDVYGSGLMGVVLTGASADGARGLDAIRRVGGTTVVQDPSTAQMSVMPAAALALGPASHVLPLEGIGRLIQSLPPGRAA